MIVLALKIVVVLAAWIAAGLALGLILGPMLRDRSSAYPVLDEDV